MNYPLTIHQAPLHINLKAVQRQQPTERFKDTNKANSKVHQISSINHKRKPAKLKQYKTTFIFISETFSKRDTPFLDLVIL